jgi:hypothetical protein
LIAPSPPTPTPTPTPTTPPTSAPTQPAAPRAPTASTAPSGPVPLTGDTRGGDAGYAVQLGMGGLIFLLTAGGLLKWWRRRSA